MCGIAGLIFNELNPDAGRLITAMTQVQFHRGPDDGGAVVFGLGGRPAIHQRLGSADSAVRWDYLAAQVALGARRLAIFDTSEAGHQPMSAGENQPWLVFNGAVYNHRELREELIAAGMSFRGRSDSEVVLAAYRHWGTACFERFEGMWAMAIFDPSAGRVVLGRDPFGIKPLYLTRAKQIIAFASEIKSLLTLPDVSRETDARPLRDFLTQGVVDHTDGTLFEGIWALPPGCLLTFDLRGANDGAAGTLTTIPRNSELKELSSLPLIRTLESSIRSHLISDVSVGSCLSGGIDSSLIVSMVHRITRNTPDADARWSQHTFTACLSGDRLDERGFAQAVANECAGLDSHFLEPSGDKLLADMTRLIWHQEQPFGSPSIYMQWEVMKAARAQGVTVLLDGQGADELYCGYEGYLPPYLASLLLRGRFLSFLREWRGVIREGQYRRAALAAHTAAYVLPEGARVQMRTQALRRRSPWLAGELFSVESSSGMAQGLGIRDQREADGHGRLNRFEAFYDRVIRHDSLPALLRFEDRNSMAHSIEARVPFLDRRVATAAMALPIEKKIYSGRLKFALREAAKGIVPEVVRTRRDKIGFAAPTAKWMRESLRDWWRESVNSKSLRERGCFAMAGVEKLAERFEAGDDNAALPLWRIALTEHWARIFMDKKSH